MRKIYTISPFIKADYIPSRSSIAGVISDHFYLFNVYSHNPYTVREYMDFIDVNFDYAFSKMKYEIISYEYPDRLRDDDSDIIEYVNAAYNLTGDYQLNRCYQMNKEVVTDLVTGSKIEIYFNDYAYYDTGLLGYSILSDVENEVPYFLLDEIEYLKDRELRSSLKGVIYQLMEYQSNLDYLGNGAIEYYDNDMISNSMLTLCQLKAYVQKILKERSE